MRKTGIYSQSFYLGLAKSVGFTHKKQEKTLVSHPFQGHMHSVPSMWVYGKNHALGAWFVKTMPYAHGICARRMTLFLRPNFSDFLSF